MPRVAIEPSRRVAELLRRRREELGWTLRDVESRTREAGHPIPYSTLNRVELGRIDPGLRRLHVLFRIYDLSLKDLAELLDLDAFVGRQPVEGTAEEIRERAIGDWKSGNVRGGLAGLAALRARVASEPAEQSARQRAILELAVAVAGLGRYSLSLNVINQLLCEQIDPTLLPRVLVQGAVCWHRLGSPEMALALVERAEAHLDRDDVTTHALILHQRASVLTSIGDTDAAQMAIRRARSQYRRAGNTYGEALAWGVEVRLELQREAFAEVAAIARKARAFALRHGHRRPATLRRLDEGRALLGLDRHEDALVALREGLGEAVERDDPVALFYAHYCLWKAYALTGEPRRSELSLASARHFLGALDVDVPEADEVRSGAPGL